MHGCVNASHKSRYSFNTRAEQRNPQNLLLDPDPTVVLKHLKSFSVSSTRIDPLRKPVSLPVQPTKRRKISPKAAILIPKTAAWNSFAGENYFPLFLKDLEKAGAWPCIGALHSDCTAVSRRCSQCSTTEG